MDFNTLQFDEPETGLGLLTLNRPDRLNAIGLDMLEELHALCELLHDHERVRVLLVTGAGRGFCAGADLRDPTMARDFTKLFSSAAAHLTAVQKRYSRLILDLRRIPQPVVAAVNGVAAGGGMCLALASDVVFAAPSARFIPSFINLGLSGGELGSSYLLPRLVGAARAAEILFTGRAVGAEEAERIGMVTRVVEEEHLLAVATETARIMLGKSVLGLRLTKEALDRNLAAPSLEAAIDLEDRTQSITCCSPDFYKAVAAFGQKKGNDPA